MSTPKVTTVANYFLKAKTIKCLATGIVIDVTDNAGYVYDKKSESITSTGGAITFWKKGVYAEILEFIKCKCKKCNEPKKE